MQFYILCNSVICRKIPFLSSSYSFLFWTGVYCKVRMRLVLWFNIGDINREMVLQSGIVLWLTLPWCLLTLSAPGKTCCPYLNSFLSIFMLVVSCAYPFVHWRFVMTQTPSIRSLALIGQSRKYAPHVVFRSKQWRTPAKFLNYPLIIRFVFFEWCTLCYAITNNRS